MELRDILRTALADQSRADSVNELISVCQKIASLFLQRKSTTGRLNRRNLALPMEDFALDAIAELFRQDEHGRLHKIRFYFEHLPIDTLTEEELLSHLRRLVFSTVNQSIFRMYNELDPGFGKILRNIKIALQSSRNLIETDRFGETQLTPIFCDSLEHLPVFHTEELTTLLRHYVNGKESIPVLVDTLSRCLREQEERCRTVPLTLVAATFRALYYPGGKTADAEVHDALITEDASLIIEQSCQALQADMTPKYLRKNVSEELIERYFIVIREYLHARIIESDGETFSYFESLRSRMPELTREEYCRNHKAKIEYLGGLAFDRSVQELKKCL
ncbi:MAG TPA: hypothetical protein VLY03_11535 [Bacteroidota bacterium]|nr:hypothetical protein [Bacteroidota bacterium]